MYNITYTSNQFMNSHVSCAKAKIIITLNGHPGCLCLFTHVTYFQMISLLNHPTSIMPSPLISRRLSQKSPLTFLYSLKTTMKAKPRLFANLWTLLLYLIKKNKICAQGSFFLIHWYIGMRQFLTTRSTYECIIVEWICEWVNLAFSSFWKNILSSRCTKS